LARPASRSAVWGGGLAEIGTLSDASVASQLLNAALDGGIVFLDTAILGTRSPEHMRTNIKLVENELPLPAEVVQELHRCFERLE